MKSPKKRGTEKVILPINGRPDGPPAESVFTSDKIEDIAMIGEIFRKLTHLGAIAIPVIYYFFGNIILYYLGGGLILSIIIDMIRFYGGNKSKTFITRYLGIMIRAHETKDFTGATYILASAIMAIIVFDKSIAVTAIAFIVVGDTAGAIIGRIWGKVKYASKSLEGSVGFFFACTIVALIVPDLPFWVKIAGAFVATLTEAFTVKIDDNLTVPLISGLFMELIVTQPLILAYFS
jgi:glycerol-3-phosphate acyltransferase PlsY